MANQYAERDIMALDKAGGHYCRHLSAMTGEGLHDKSDIAAELAYRDARIAQLEADCAAHKAAEETQIALRQKADEREAALINLLNHFKAATIKASMNGFGQDDEHHDDSWIDDLDHALTRTQHHDAKLRKQASQC